MRVIVEGAKYEDEWSAGADRVYAESDWLANNTVRCKFCHNPLPFYLARGVFTAECCGYKYRASEWADR